jgi:hypothetical protein
MRQDYGLTNFENFRARLLCSFLDEKYCSQLYGKSQRRGTKSGKPTKAHVSCRKFHSGIGMAPNQRSSREKKGEFISGSGACPMALWRLVHTRIEISSPGTRESFPPAIGTGDN